MARIRVVINDEHSVQAHDVVVEGLLCTVIVIPESAHLFPCIAIAAKRVEARVAVRVEMVFPTAAREEVARKTVAFRTMVPVVQVDGYLGVAKRVISGRRRAVPEPHDCGFTISIQDGWAGIDTIETPDICVTIVGVEPVQAGSGFQFGGYMRRGELSPALMIRSGPFTRTCVGYLLGRRAQWMVYRWERNR
jgi:hypothetical protein